MLRIETSDKCYLFNPAHIALVEVERMRTVLFITTTVGRQIKFIRSDEPCSNGLQSAQFDLLLDELEAL
jgi:hypothetical protein